MSVDGADKMIPAGLYRIVTVPLAQPCRRCGAKIKQVVLLADDPSSGSKHEFDWRCDCGTIKAGR